jgi:hypothetical protein
VGDSTGPESKDGDQQPSSPAGKHFILVRPYLEPLIAELVTTSGIGSDSHVLDDVVDVQSSLGDLDYRLASFRNDRGYVRRRLVTGLELGQRADLDVLCAAYSEWLLDDIYITFKHTVSRTTIQSRQMESRAEHVVIKARKRGNDIDAYRIDRRMKALREGILPYVPNNLRSTSALYITGTVDPKQVPLCVSPSYRSSWAWSHLGQWFNSFLAGLRKKCRTIEVFVKNGKLFAREVCAKIYVLRSWESHESGWPHFHAILCFEGYHWKIFQFTSKKTGRTTWRVKDKNKIAESWTHGFVDVLALTRGTLDKNILSVLWYVSKNLSDMDYRLVRSWPLKRRQTESILWHFGMRSFSVSRALLSHDCEPSEDEFIKPSSITQVGQHDLEGNLAILEEHLWEFIGLVRRTDTELARDDWEKTYPNPPDWLDRTWQPWNSHGGLGWSSSWLSGGS